MQSFGQVFHIICQNLHLRLFMTLIARSKKVMGVQMPKYYKFDNQRLMLELVKIWHGPRNPLLQYLLTYFFHF